MNIDETRKIVKELDLLTLYHEKLEKMLNTVRNGKTHYDCVSSFKLKDTRQPAAKLEVFDKDNEIIDWEGLELPPFLKKTPFYVIPNATARLNENYEEQFDINLQPELLLVLFEYLLRKIETRINILKTRLAS